MYLKAQRYRYLVDILLEKKPEHVVEIGTWDGSRAREFMALTDCYYTGFDLFEGATKATDKKEFNVRSHEELMLVGRFIEFVGFSKFCLIRGDTNDILPTMCVSSATAFGAGITIPSLEDGDGERILIPPFDFAFIDGGHSVETIKNDYEWARKNISKGGTIILDDYYDPELGGLGCNFLSEFGEVLPSTDKTDKGFVHLLRVDIKE